RGLTRDGAGTARPHARAPSADDLDATLALREGAVIQDLRPAAVPSLARGRLAAGDDGAPVVLDLTLADAAAGATVEDELQWWGGGGQQRAHADPIGILDANEDERLRPLTLHHAHRYAHVGTGLTVLPGTSGAS